MRQIIRSNSAAKRRLIAGESAVSKKYCPLERSSPGASILVRRAGSPGNLHCSICLANKTISVCHRACMIERILTAAIYKWLDGSNIQSSDLIYPFLAKQYGTANAFACLFEKFECESELEISNGSLNSLTLNRAESFLDNLQNQSQDPRLIQRISLQSDTPQQVCRNCTLSRHTYMYKVYT